MFSHFVRKLKIILGIHRGPIDLSQFEYQGWHWQTTPAGALLFKTSPPTLENWLSSASIVKQNLQRTIVRVEHASETLYVKLCRANTPRSWARELLRPAKARLEFDNALSLQRRGIPAIVPLGWASRSRRWPGDSIIVTQELAGAVPLLELLETATLQRSWIEKFAQFLARLHDAGVGHPDPHPGNFLVVDGMHFYLTDVHALHFGSPLSWSATLDNLILLNRWFQMRATPLTRHRFWRAYLHHRQTLADGLRKQRARDVEAGTMASNCAFWRARMSRYVSNNRDSKNVRQGAVSGYAVRELPNVTVQRWLADPDQPFNGNITTLKDSPSATVVVEYLSGTPTYLLKRYRLRSWMSLLKNLLRATPALRGWLNSNNVRDRGLPTPQVLAMFQRRRFCTIREGYLVFEYLPNAMQLNQAVRLLAQQPKGWRRLRTNISALASLIHTMHERQVAHRDLKAPNILVPDGIDSPDPLPFLLIDLDNAKIGQPLSLNDRLTDLTRLNASFLGADTVISSSDRLRFLKRYLGTRTSWKKAWQSIARRTEAKIERNQRRQRPLL